MVLGEVFHIVIERKTILHLPRDRSTARVLWHDMAVSSVVLQTPSTSDRAWSRRSTADSYVHLAFISHPSHLVTALRLHPATSACHLLWSLPQMVFHEHADRFDCHFLGRSGSAAWPRSFSSTCSQENGVFDIALSKTLVTQPALSKGWSKLQIETVARYWHHPDLSIYLVCAQLMTNTSYTLQWATWFILRYWHYRNHLFTYLLTYIPAILTVCWLSHKIPWSMRHHVALMMALWCCDMRRFNKCSWHTQTPFYSPFCRCTWVIIMACCWVVSQFGPNVCVSVLQSQERPNFISFLTECHHIPFIYMPSTSIVV